MVAVHEVFGHRDEATSHEEKEEPKEFIELERGTEVRVPLAGMRIRRPIVNMHTYPYGQVLMAYIQSRKFNFRDL